MIPTFVTTIAISAIVFVLLVIAHKVLLGVWAYLDAKERGFSGDVGWAFLVALVPLYIGLIIYVCVRPSRTQGGACPACKAPNAPAAKFCAACGAQMESIAPIVPQHKRSRRALVAFFICLGAAILLFFAMIFSSIRFAFQMGRAELPRMKDYFRQWQYSPDFPDVPDFDFDFHIGDGNNT